MKNAFHLSLMASAFLAGCSQADPAANADANDTNVAAAPAEAPVTNIATPAAAPVATGGAVTADYMVGKWSAMDEDCKDTLDFRKDGTVVTPIGEAKWTLTGDQLLVDWSDGSKQKPTTIKVLSPQKIEITKASGGKETQIRC